MSHLSGNNVSSSSNKELEGDNSRVIGPILPPHLLDRSNVSSTSPDSNYETNANDAPQEKQSSTIGPILPSHLSNKTNPTETQCSVIGPSLPAHLLNRERSHSDNENDSEDSHEVPDSSSTQDEELASTKLSESSSSSYGPALPPHLQKPVIEENSDDEDAFGPLPPGASSSSCAHQALEERALQIKLGLFDTNESKGTVREEWMMELPEVRAGNLGLGARQFRKNARPDFSDRSSWTDTPEQKKKKKQGKVETQVDLKKEAELREIIKHDKEQSKLIQEHNKKIKRDKSLLEMHQEEVKKKKKQEEKDGLPTRRPFNREIDLKVNQFDDAQKKSIMKKAMHLDDRFSKGQSKFL